MADLKYEILEELGTLSTSKSGWEMQLNVVQWGANKPKYDLRTWSPDHAKMGKGLTLTRGEIEKLHELLGQALAAGDGQFEMPEAVETQSQVLTPPVLEPAPTSQPVAHDYLADMYYADKVAAESEAEAEADARPKWGRLGDL
ncbi:YdbC family protein [Weissella cibaria]|uniref:YdbC family protein n=1 Tax=Weissella cibaria TaxID=137591 RepID=UPI000BFFB4AF|nr:PC4/YdbC family ssDNA-binding protein [Weissella cibaria]